MLNSIDNIIQARDVFPDKNIQRSHGIIGFYIAIFICFIIYSTASLILPDSLSFLLAVAYPAFFTLKYSELDLTLSLQVSSAVTIGFSISVLFALFTTCFAVIMAFTGAALLGVIPFIWRDRIFTGELENEHTEILKLGFQLAPEACWCFYFSQRIASGNFPELQIELLEEQRTNGFRKTGKTCYNWSGLEKSHPNTIFHPTSVEDLQEIVIYARDNDCKVRAVGRNYSWTPWGSSNDILVESGGLNKLEMDLSDPSNPRLIVESGATNRQINVFLEAHGYTLSSNVVLEVVRIGGLISTGSHGSGWNESIVADYIHTVDIVDAHGEIRHYEEGVTDKEIMNAARVNFGMFGLIWRFSLNVIPAVNVHYQDFHCTKEELYANIKEWVTTFDAVDVFYFPFAKKVWIKTQQRLISTQPAKSLRKSALELVISSVQMEFLRLLLIVLEYFPKLTIYQGEISMLVTPKNNVIVPLADWTHHRRAADSVPMGNIEIGFDLDDNFDNFVEAWEMFEDLTNEYAKKGEYPFTVAANARFINHTDALLSPANGEGKKCFIEVLSGLNTHGWPEFSKDLGGRWLQLPNAAPHWPKEWRHFTNIEEHLKTRHGKNVKRFEEIRQELNVDPDDMFINDMCKTLLNLGK